MNTNIIDSFLKSLSHCALDESSLSIRSVNSGSTTKPVVEMG